MLDVHRPHQFAHVTHTALAAEGLEPVDDPDHRIRMDERGSPDLHRACTRQQEFGRILRACDAAAADQVRGRTAREGGEEDGMACLAGADGDHTSRDAEIPEERSGRKQARAPQRRAPNPDENRPL